MGSRRKSNVPRGLAWLLPLVLMCGAATPLGQARGPCGLDHSLRLPVLPDTIRVCRGDRLSGALRFDGYPAGTYHVFIYNYGVSRAPIFRKVVVLAEQP